MMNLVKMNVGHDLEKRVCNPLMPIAVQSSKSSIIAQCRIRNFFIFLSTAAEFNGTRLYALEEHDVFAALSSAAEVDGT